jgi:hypothetical protein
LRSCHRFFKFTLQKISLAYTGVAKRGQRIQLNHSRVFRARFLLLSYHRQIAREKRPGLGIHRVQRDRPAGKIETLRHFAASARKISRPHQQHRILRGQSKSLAQCLCRTFPIIIEICFDRRPREQRIRQVWLEGESSLQCLARIRKMVVEAFLATLGGVVAIPDVSLGQPRPRQRELRIQLRRAFISGPGSVRFFF